MGEKANRRRAHEGQSAAVAAAAEPLELLIRRRAYELYLERGDRPGDALEDWLQAEREACAR
jgi:hypothetical protein